MPYAGFFLNHHQTCEHGLFLLCKANQKLVFSWSTHSSQIRRFQSGVTLWRGEICIIWETVCINQCWLMIACITACDSRFMSQLCSSFFFFWHLESLYDFPTHVYLHHLREQRGGANANWVKKNPVFKPKHKISTQKQNKETWIDKGFKKAPKQLHFGT